MPSIVSALDEPYREWLEEAAGEVKAVTGRRELVAPARPHVTLHVAERYTPGIEGALGRFALSEAPLTFTTGEVGVFRGPQMVVALQVLRNDALLRFQADLRAAIVPFAERPKPVYGAETWAPHITIVAGRIDPAHIEGIIAVLGRRDFAWTVPLTNVCLVPDASAHDWLRFDIGGANG